MLVGEQDRDGRSRRRFAFVMEQTLGMVTHYRNLRPVIDADPCVDATWYPLAFEPSDSMERLPVLRTNWSARASWRTSRLLARDRARDRYHALFFHTQVTTLLSTAVMRRVPSVISLDATPKNFDEVGSAYGHRRSSRLSEGVKWTVNARSFRTAQALVAWSHWAGRSLVADYGVSADRVHVIPPGVDLERWSIPAQRSVDAPNSGRPFRLLFVGGDFERKGGPLLRQVFREHLRDVCELHIVTKASVSDETGVRVYRGLGPNDQALRDLYACCDAFVLPTQDDCFSLASIEAMACGLPVISCPVGGIPEIIREGQTGFLVTPNDGSALLRAIQVLAADPVRASRMGRAGRVVVEECFDHVKNAKRIIDLMSGLVRS